jgi:hypothetical protein
VHRVDVNFCKERGGRSDDGRNKYLSKLSKLARVARANEPKNVGVHMWPPETFRNVRSCREETFVTDVVVCDAHNINATVGEEDELVCTVTVFAPESVVIEEKLYAITKEGGVLGVGQVRRSVEVF